MCGPAKAQLIGKIARNFARSVPAVEAGAVEAALLAREELGSTSLGGGFALPHAQIEDLEGYLGMFLWLAKPIGFCAVDGNPVGMVFALLTPGALAVSHVSVLATISHARPDLTFAYNKRAAANHLPLSIGISVNAGF